MKKEPEARNGTASRTPTAQEWEAWFRKTVDDWNRRFAGGEPLSQPRPWEAHQDESAPAGHHLIHITRACGEPALGCPVCGFEYVHPVGLVCHSAGSRNTALRVDAHGIHQNPCNAPWGRGVRITLEFLCEGGHRFDYSLSFHKGWTFVERQMSHKELEFEEQPRTIWRD